MSTATKSPRIIPQTTARIFLPCPLNRVLAIFARHCHHRPTSQQKRQPDTVAFSSALAKQGTYLYIHARARHLFPLSRRYFLRTRRLPDFFFFHFLCTARTTTIVANFLWRVHYQTAGPDAFRLLSLSLSLIVYIVSLLVTVDRRSGAG